MFMVVVAMVTDLTIVMATILLVHHIGEDPNHHPTTKAITPTDTNHTVHGVLLVTDLSMVTEVPEDVKVLSWSKNSSDKY